MSSKVEKNLLRVGPIFNVIFYPEPHVCVQEHILRLLLHQVAALLKKPSDSDKYAHPRLNKLLFSHLVIGSFKILDLLTKALQWGFIIVAA